MLTDLLTILDQGRGTLDCFAVSVWVLGCFGVQFNVIDRSPLGRIPKDTSG